MPIPPPPRRHRTSLTNGPEDISHLTLYEVRERLERNWRVLGTSLFSNVSPPISPAASVGTSPTSPILGSTARPSTSGSGASPSVDPVRERLLSVREQLLAREKELCARATGAKTEHDTDHQMIIESSANALKRSEDGVISAVGRQRGNRARTMDVIAAGEGNLARNGLIL